jgi:hypothetical protein
MSIALETRLAAAEKRIADLERKPGGMTRQDMLAHIAQLELRLERLEAVKPAPKERQHGR